MSDDLEAVCVRLNADPRDADALRILVGAIEARTHRVATGWRDFGKQHRDDVFADVVARWWKLAGMGRLPTEAVAPQIAASVSNRFTDYWRRSRRSRVVSTSPGDGDDGDSLLDRVGEPDILETDPLARLQQAFDRALEARRPQDREALQRSWRRFWRVILEGGTLTEVATQELGEKGVSAATRAHSRLVQAVVARVDDDEDRRLFKELLHLKAVSEVDDADRPNEQKEAP